MDQLVFKATVSLSVAIILAGCASDYSVPDSVKPVTSTPSNTVISKPITSLGSNQAVRTVAEAPSSLGFTIDEFLAQNKDLRPLEGLGDFKQTSKFAADFKDGDGGITGEFFKKSRKLDHLSVIGSGEDWSAATQSAIALAIGDPGKAQDILTQGGFLSGDPTGFKYSENGVQIGITKIADNFVCIISCPNSVDLDPKPDGNNAYITPTIGITLNHFKKVFNSTMKEIDPHLSIKGSGSETTSDTYFSYPFTDATNLNVTANDRMVVEQVDLESVPKDARMFWKIAQGCVVATSNLSMSESKAILSKLGCTQSMIMPTSGNDFDSNGRHYSYAYMNDTPPGGCVLSIQSNSP